MGNLRRRIIEKSEEDPILIKLTNPGSYTQYSFLSGYEYVDMLICGGGGSGGYNSGGGGGSGTILYVKNFMLDRLPELEITYNIASSSSGNGNPTEVIIKGETITVPGGMSGGNHGFNGSNGGYGGNGGYLNESSIISILSKYVSDKLTDIAISSNGGGSGGYWNSSQSKYGYGGGSGSTMSQSGISGSGSTGGKRTTNSDGTGGNRGGNHGLSGYGNSYGSGYKRNDIIIPISTIFEGGGGGHGKNGGRGNGGQGIICFYYHN
jgi:hypothetical protein